MISRIVNTNAAITMTSLELVDYINSQRTEGDAELRHDSFMGKVPKVLGEAAAQFIGAAFYTNGTGGKVSRAIYTFVKREACLMAMSYSYDLQAKLYDKMTALETQAAPAALSTMDILKLAIVSEEGRLAAVAQLAIAAPKVAFMDDYVDATGLRGFREVCKLLGANENLFRDFLFDKKIMYRLAGEMMPNAPHLDAGRFVVKTGKSGEGHAFNTAKFTAKGVAWVAGLWAVHGLDEAA